MIKEASFLYETESPTPWWYNTPRWQAWEKEADEDWEAGRYEIFESMDEFLESLDD